MLRKVNLGNVFLLMLIAVCFNACKGKRAADEKVIVTTPEQMDDKVSHNIRAVLQYANDNDGEINDQQKLSYPRLVDQFYKSNEYRGFWSSMEQWNPIADSMFYFIKNSRYFGLYPEDYHFNELDTLRQRIAIDSSVRMDAIAWTKADLLFTDALMKALKELKEGRMIADSVSIIHKENYIDSFFVKNLSQLKNDSSVTSLLKAVEPQNNEYLFLRTSLKEFVDSMDTREYLSLNYPYKDSLAFIKKTYQRLLQSNYGNAEIKSPDSATFTKALRKYQADHQLIVDGIAGPGVVRSLNNTDVYKFKQIAITLDRYKLLPKLPEKYIWVNIPGFKLKVWDADSLIMESKVIVGKSSTPTPIFSSAITDMVTYPQWTIPNSIIRKDILPQLKKDPGYLARKGFSLVSYQGETINPYTVNWMKYSKGIPWKVVQGSGDDNALGVFKFNFNNPYSVYLHDTNQRYLFKNSNRALSHGCVRVEKWQDLAFYIAQLDSLAMKNDQLAPYNADSIKTWINNKDRKKIMVKSRLPLYIEYFTVEGKNGKILFYDDIYKNDQFLAKKYFSGK